MSNLLSDLWDNVKCSQVCIIAAPKKKRERNWYLKKSEEWVKEGFPNLVKNLNPRNKETKPTLCKKLTSRKNIIKLLTQKIKKKILKQPEGKMAHYAENNVDQNMLTSHLK